MERKYDIEKRNGFKGINITFIDPELDKLQQKVNQLEEENKQLKERIEYYYEFDEELKKEDLPEELRPYYKNQDCCRYIVELRKENQELKKQLEHFKTQEIERISKNLSQAENDYLERCIKANMVGGSNE